MFQSRMDAVPWSSDVAGHPGYFVHRFHPMGAIFVSKTARLEREEQVIGRIPAEDVERRAAQTRHVKDVIDWVRCEVESIIRASRVDAEAHRRMKAAALNRRKRATPPLWAR